MIKVFYDGKCGLCSKEIRHYQAVAPEGVFEWQDITALPQSQLENEGLDLAQSLKHLHAKDSQGNIHIGVDAFLLIWQSLARWRWLARLIALPGLYTLTGFAYRGFAKWRFQRLGHCQIASQNNQT